MNLNYILHEFFADWSNFFAQRSRKHHDLFAMRSIAENFLNVTSHICCEEKTTIQLVSI